MQIAQISDGVIKAVQVIQRGVAHHPSRNTRVIPPQLNHRKKDHQWTCPR